MDVGGEGGVEGEEIGVCVDEGDGRDCDLGSVHFSTSLMVPLLCSCTVSVLVLGS